MPSSAVAYTDADLPQRGGEMGLKAAALAAEVRYGLNDLLTILDHLKSDVNDALDALDAYDETRET